MSYLAIKTDTLPAEVKTKLEELNSQMIELDALIYYMPSGVVKAACRVFFKSTIRFANFVLAKTIKDKK